MSSASSVEQLDRAILGTRIDVTELVATVARRLARGEDAAVATRQLRQAERLYGELHVRREIMVTGELEEKAAPIAEGG